MGIFPDTKVQADSSRKLIDGSEIAADSFNKLARSEVFQSPVPLRVFLSAQKHCFEFLFT
jgi:hypothetical protein